MAKLRAVGFDLDGTLFDHRGSAAAGLSDFFDALEIEPTSDALDAWFSAEDEQYEHWRTGQISFQEQRRERLRAVLPALGADLPTDEGMLDELFTRYLRACRAHWRPFSDSAYLLRSLRSSGYRVGVLTNGTQEQQLDKLGVIGLLDILDAVCTSERIGAQKPDSRAFAALADELGVEPSSCLFVGDNAEHDLAGAESSGMRALLIDRYGDHGKGIVAAVRAELAVVR